jgi:hypothetical protein
VWCDGMGFSSSLDGGPALRYIVAGNPCIVCGLSTSRSQQYTSCLIISSLEMVCFKTDKVFQLKNYHSHICGSTSTTTVHTAKNLHQQIVRMTSVITDKLLSRKPLTSTNKLYIKCYIQGKPISSFVCKDLAPSLPIRQRCEIGVCWPLTDRRNQIGGISYVLIWKRGLCSCSVWNLDCHSCPCPSCCPSVNPSRCSLRGCAWISCPVYTYFLYFHYDNESTVN